MPQNTLTELDEYLVTTPLRTRFIKLKRAISEIFGVKQKASKVALSVDDKAARTRRQDGLERFLLTLSDQQLVTGLAVLIAGYSKVYSMSIYHFNVVGSLAWFSSATHLATLGALRKYLVAHRAVRDWRVVAMVFLLVLLLVAQLPEWTSRDNSVPICCFFLDVEIEPDFSNVVTLLTTIGFLIDIYVKRIARLYSHDLDWNVTDSLIEIFVKLLVRKDKYRQPSHRAIAKKLSGLSPTSISAAVRAERERVRYERFKLAIENSHRRSRSYTLAVIFIAGEYSYSFTSQITIMIFDLAYGFAYTITNRSDSPGGGIKGNQNEMGFGQLVPLFLLLLPALAVGEIYFETQTETDSTATAMPSEGSLPMQSASLHVPSPMMNAQANNDTMSETDERAHADDEDSGNSRSGALDSASMDNHEDAKTRLTFERLVKILDSATLTLPTLDKSSSDEDSDEGLGALNHMSTGIALGKYQNYQAERSDITSDHPQTAANTGTEEAPVASDGQSTHSNATTVVSPSSAQIPTSQSRQQPQTASNTGSGQPINIPNPYYSGIHYRRILACISIFTLGYQILFALALGGVFGGWGNFLASVFLVLLLTVSFIVVVDGVRQRMWEIKMDITKK
ncbi:MAG: hypothetical protein Q9195_003651 [Heterodermia aff. obscurata]